jgi:hypothetical protein
MRGLAGGGQQARPHDAVVALYRPIGAKEYTLLWPTGRTWIRPSREAGEGGGRDEPKRYLPLPRHTLNLMPGAWLQK